MWAFGLLWPHHWVLFGATGGGAWIGEAVVELSTPFSVPLGCGKQLLPELPGP